MLIYAMGNNVLIRKIVVFFLKARIALQIDHEKITLWKPRKHRIDTAGGKTPR